MKKKSGLKRKAATSDEDGRCCALHCERRFGNALERMCSHPFTHDFDFVACTVQELAAEIAVSKNYRFESSRFVFSLDFGALNRNHPLKESTLVCRAFFLKALAIDESKWISAMRALHNDKTESENQYKLLKSLHDAARTYAFRGELIRDDLVHELADCMYDARHLLKASPSNANHGDNAIRCGRGVYAVFLAGNPAQLLQWKQQSAAVRAREKCAKNNTQSTRMTKKFVRQFESLFAVKDTVWRYAGNDGALRVFPIAQAPRLLRASLLSAGTVAADDKMLVRFLEKNSVASPPPRVAANECVACSFWPQPNMELLETRAKHALVHEAASFASERLLEAEIVLRRAAFRNTPDAVVFQVDGGAVDFGVCNVHLPKAARRGDNVSVLAQSAALFVCHNSLDSDSNCVTVLPLDVGNVDYDKRALYLACECIDMHFDFIASRMPRLVKSAAPIASKRRKPPVFNIVTSLRHTPLSEQSTLKLQRHFARTVERCAEKLRAASIPAVLQAMLTQVPLVHCVSSFVPSLYEKVVAAHWQELEYGDFDELAVALSTHLPHFVAAVPSDANADCAFSEHTAACAVEGSVQQDEPTSAVRVTAYTARFEDAHAVADMLHSLHLPFKVLTEPVFMLCEEDEARSAYEATCQSVLARFVSAWPSETVSVFVQRAQSAGTMSHAHRSEREFHAALTRLQSDETPYVALAARHALASTAKSSVEQSLLLGDNVNGTASEASNNTAGVLCEVRARVKREFLCAADE